MKKFYEEAELEIIKFGSKDIIATSGGEEPGDGGDGEIELPDIEFGD